MEWLFSWEVTSVVVAVFIGVGFAFLALSDFKRTKVCFLFAAADAVGGMVMWGIKSDFSPWARNVIAFLSIGLIGVLAIQSLRYVDRKKKSTEAPKSPVVINGIDFEPFEVGKKMVGRLHYSNTSDTNITIRVMYQISVIESPPSDKMQQAQDQLWRMFEGQQLKTIELTLPPGSPIMGPMLGAILTPEEEEALKCSKGMVFVTGGFRMKT